MRMGYTVSPPSDFSDVYRQRATWYSRHMNFPILSVVMINVNPCSDGSAAILSFGTPQRNSNRDVDGPRGCPACLQAPHLNNTCPSTLYSMLHYVTS